MGYNITGDRRRKSKLSQLAHLFLNKEIQTEGKRGHNPIEDAQAAMNLVLLKLEKGYEFGDVILGGEVPNMTEEGGNVVGGMDKRHDLVTSLFKTAKQQEKTVAIVADKITMEEYDRFPALVAEAKYVKAGESIEEVMDMGCDAAVNHNMTICHVDMAKEVEGKTSEDVMKKVKKMAKKMFGFTSLNGLFMLILGGDSKQNGVVGIALNKNTDIASFEA